MSLTWNDEAQEQVNAEAWNRLRQATVFFHGTVQQVLNVPNTGERRKRTRNTVAGRKGSQYTVYPNPSLPGEPPRKRTGWLQRNVVYRFVKAELRALVGITVNAPYGLFLELGTRMMDARPWLAATLRKVWPQLQTILGGGKAA